MTSQEYRNRLYSSITKAECIVKSVDLNADIESIKNRLMMSLKQVSSEADAIQELDRLKSEIISLLSETLTKVQIAFVEMDEPDGSDYELFNNYLSELKSYKENLMNSDSETRGKIRIILVKSKNSLINELSCQAIIFPTECLDAILYCPEVEQENGADWVVEQINEALKTLIEELNVRLGATFDAVNELLGSEIDVLEESYTQSISLNRSISTSISDEMFGVARQSLPSLGIGSLGYGITAAMFNPIAGIVVGLTTGGLFLWKSHKIMTKQQRISEIKKKLTPKLTLVINELKNYVQERFDEFIESVNNWVKTMIEVVDKEIKDYNDALRSCDNEIKEFNMLQKQLDNKMTTLEAYIKQLEILNTNPLIKT